MRVLVTGAAGYVGSVVSEELLRKGHEVIILDNLQQGHQRAILPEIEFVLGDICCIPALEGILGRTKIDAVMHMAAETVVEYSISDPRRYFHNNVIGGINVLDTMLKHDVYKIIFSSSASVYGEPESVPITEEHPKLPVNSYGESKLMYERILDWYGKAYGIKLVSLRYFNAAGASRRLGEDHHPETHLIPNVLTAALDKNTSVPVFGTDYPTRDGSCIRDYIHVIDVAQAHCLALEKIETLENRAYNLGNGQGFSVLEIINVAREVTGADIPIRELPRRPGDPAVLVADSNRARSELGWTPQFAEIRNIVETAWDWRKEHPRGYG